jgi:peptide/nickel transport system substrate-binding protein
MLKLKKFSLILMVVLVFAIALSACADETPANNNNANNVETGDNEPANNNEEPADVEEPADTEEPEVGFEAEPFGENLPTAPTIDTPLVVAYNPFSNKFSPFFAESGYDFDVVSMTQITVLTTDRVGGIIHNAIEGETVNYNGVDYLYKGPANTSVVYDPDTDTTVYTARLRVGMTFSDGVPITIDDLIFTYYTLLDPTFVGSSTLGSYDIIGLQDYQTQTTSDVFDKYAALAEEIYAAGRDHEWSDADGWTQEQQEDFWAKLYDEWLMDVKGIVTYVNNNYRDAYCEPYTGYPAADIAGNESMEIMCAMVLWGFGEINEEGALVTYVTESTFDLVENFPTYEDYYTETFEAYGGDPVEYAAVESAVGADVLGNTNSKFIGYWGPLDESMGGEGVPNIAGIVKLDDYTVEVTVNGYSAPAVYQILGQDIAPLHYYGDVEKYDYENNMFGFDFGDLSLQHAVTATPLGGGPYKFVEYENKVVYFEANENYYRGCPEVAELQFKETVSAEVASAVQTATVDAGEMTGSRTRFEEVASYNSNGEITGDVITTSKVDNLGYGFAGIHADNVKVGDDAGSEESKNLRRAFATILAVYRDVAIDSYYGEAASVINYPISNTSWAAPQPTDEGYQIAFSVDVDGNPIYTAEMTQEEKYVAAEAAALGFLEAAGYTVEGGKVTAAPEGAKLSYEAIIPGDGTGDHPAFAIFTGAQESLANIGMEMTINDPADSNVLWDALSANQQELFTMAWGATIDPDMYQVYHSSGVPLDGGSDSNYYAIRDAELDQLILDARASDDQNYRKAIYKQALDRIIDWAVEIPTYQRQNSIIFSTERMVIGSITPDITTFWDWIEDIELVQMVQ